jgi:uncharacterized protein (TIGR03083 family)
MACTSVDAHRWMRHGTALLLEAADLDDDKLDAPSSLPDWTRKHVVAHVAANAQALGNLVHWAATGEVTPMYSSPEERAIGIQQGSRRSAGELTAWLRHSAETLETAMASLDEKQWQARVMTAQGRTVPATELPWMRSREVYVHAIDLATGLSFSDLPADFLAALCDDVIGKRSTGPGPALVLEAADTGDRWKLAGAGEAVKLAGSLHEITAYLTGRGHNLTTGSGEPAPILPAWL